MGVPQNGWFIREYPIKMDDFWGYPHLWTPPYFIVIAPMKITSWGYPPVFSQLPCQSQNGEAETQEVLAATGSVANCFQLLSVFGG